MTPNVIKKGLGDFYKISFLVFTNTICSLLIHGPRLKWTSSVGWANYVQHLFKNLDQRKVELASVRSKNIYRKQIDFGPKGPFLKKSHTQ